MKKLIKLIRMMKDRPLIDVWYYLQGNYRYFFWYGGKLSRKFGFIAWLRKGVIRDHIKKQIEFRIRFMNKDCYGNGECKLCGCQTLNLQMCNKSCDKPCYPPMMSAKQWDRFYFCNEAYRDLKTGKIFLYSFRKQELKVLTEKTYNYVEEQ